MVPAETVFTNLRDSERVVLYPSFAYPAADRSGWMLQVHGSVLSSVPAHFGRKVLVAVLGRLMGASPEELETNLFNQRIQGFTFYQQGGKQIAINIGGRLYQLRDKSKKNGQFHGTVFIPAEDVDSIALARGSVRHVPYTIHSEYHAASPLRGMVQLIEDRGVSIISDIDDTVKHTQVSIRKDMLANTFLREFQPVPGMVQLYQKWQQEGAAFHYVTSSPWQLFEPLSEHFRELGLPEGSFHMKSVRFRDATVLQLFIGRRKEKRKAIELLLTTFPGRKFVFVGDSGEKDPEMYGEMARKFPGQLLRIFIRDLKGRNSSPWRYRKSFGGLPSEMWQLFEDADELMEQSVDILSDCQGSC